MRYQARYRWALLLALLLSSYDFYARVMPRTLLKVHAFAAPRAQRAPLSAPVLPAAALAQLAGHFSPGTTADEPGLAASAAAAQAQAQAQAGQPLFSLNGNRYQLLGVVVLQRRGGGHPGAARKNFALLRRETAAAGGSGSGKGAVIPAHAASGPAPGTAPPAGAKGLIKLSQGDTIEGLRVEQIASTEVTLVGRGHRYRIRLFAEPYFKVESLTPQHPPASK